MVSPLWCRIGFGLDGTWSDFTRDATTPANGTFPYYSAGVIGEAYGPGNYKVSNGRYYSQGTARVWYPAPGYRHRDAGVLANVGYYGYSWSSSVSGISGLCLYFNATSLNPSNAYYRAYGFPVRCLQE